VALYGGHKTWYLSYLNISFLNYTLIDKWGFKKCSCTCHTSHDIHHMTHITWHTSHDTHHMTHITWHTSHDTHHMTHITLKQNIWLTISNRVTRSLWEECLYKVL